MAYLEWSGGSNAAGTIICVHGLTRNGRDFDGIAPDLVAMGYRVICPDIVGRGDSDWLPSANDYGYPQYLRDIMVLLARLDVDAVDWLGTSMGGLIGMMLSAMPGHPIRKLIMNDVGCVIPLAALKRIAEYTGVDPVFANMDEAEQYYRRIAAPFGRLSDAEWRYFSEYSVRTLPNGGYAPAYDPAIAVPLRTMMPEGDLDLSAIWQKVTISTLIIRGQDSDLLLPDIVQMMLQSGSHVQSVTFADCGHAPLLWAGNQRQDVLHWLRG